jgi:hypothetical protein
VIDDAGLLADELAGREDGEVGDAAYVVTRCELLIAVGIDFEDDGVAREVLSGACDLGCGCAAGSAPVGPEVHEDRNAGALDDLVEERCIYLQGLVERE